MPFPFLAVIISTAISYGLTLVAALLSPRPKAATSDQIQVPTATEDRIKPYFVGTVRHTSPNCTWYGDFSTKKIKQSGIAAILSLGLAPSLGFKYFIGAMLHLAWGEMDAIRRIEIGGKEAWTGTVSTGNITIDKPELISSGPVKDGFQATVVVYNGNGTQTADSYVDSKVAGSIPAYKNDAYLVFKGLTSGGAYIGNTATFPQINVDISRYPNSLAVTGSKHIIDTYDANPVCALYEFLTRDDVEFGAGFVSSQFNLTNWRAAAEQVYADGIGISRLITNDSDIQTVIQDYLKLIDGVINVNMQTGLIEIKLARFDYDPDTIPHFTDDDFLEIQYTRGSWSETTNEIKLSYIDRTDNFTDRIAAAQDSASAAGNSEIGGQSIDIQGVSNPTTANQIVWREIRAVSTPLGRLTAKMNRNGYGLAGGSVFKWTSETYGVEAMIFRIAELTDGEMADGTIQLKCAQDVFALGETAFLPANGTGWTPVDGTASVIATEAIFQQPIGFHSTAQRRVFTVAKRPDTTQQAYDLWTKKSTDSDYTQKLSGVHFTPTGTVTSTFISGTDTTLTVTPDTDMEDLPTPVSVTEINNGAGLILIGSEILAYESYTISGGNYVFAGVHSHPGLYGTTPATHATAARVWFISEGMGLDPTDYPAGATVNAKLLPTTPTQTLPIGSASVISVTVDSSTITGIVGGIPVDGSPADGDVLIYDSSSGTYVPSAPPGGALADGDYGDVTVSSSGTHIAVDSGLPATRIGGGTVDDTEFGYLNGVTSALQTQIDAKAPLASPALTGNPTAPTPSPGDNDTSIATTAFVTAAISATPSFDIHALSAKTTPVDADEIALADSAASFAAKKSTWTNVKAFLKTYFDTLYQAILVSGTNIKTLNGSTLLGSGNLSLASLSSITSGLYAAPRTGHTEDDEFEGTVQDAKWTKTNSASIESFDDHIRSAAYYQFNTTLSDVTLKQSYANTGDFSITACFSVYMATNFHNVTMYIRDSTAANYVEMQMLYNGAPTFRTCKNVSSVFSQVTSTNFSGLQGPATSPQFFMHIQRSGNNWTTYFSFDGVCWTTQSAAVGVTMTVDNIFLSFGQGGAATKTYIALHWIRRDWLTL